MASPTLMISQHALQPTPTYTWHEKALPTGTCGLTVANKHSQLHQDMWALEQSSCKRSGFYMDIGSNDGSVLSNTFMLDTKFGWQGVCSDPFPHNMANRTCAVAQGVVWSEAGKPMTFDQADGGDDVFSKVDEVSSNREGAIAKSNQNFHQVTMMSKTANQIFEEHKVPPVVDFLSLDVEGSETHVLHGINFQAHCFRNVAVETNLREPDRSDMRTLFESKGYTYAGSEKFDDYYTNACA